MRIIAYRLGKQAPLPQTIRARRVWMDNFPDSRPYHCLPMTVANSYGWEMVCQRDCEATWTGGETTDALTVIGRGGGEQHLPKSRFGNGILTFLSRCIIRTEAPYHLFIMGPINMARDGLSPLTAMIDSSWAPFPLNMSYQFTRPQTVRFEKGEPWCQIFPCIPDAIEEMTTEVRDVEPGTDVWRDHYEWTIIKNLTRGGIAIRDPSKQPEESGSNQRHCYHHYYRNAVRSNGERIAPRPKPRFNAEPFVDPAHVKGKTISDRDHVPGDLPGNAAIDGSKQIQCPVSSKHSRVRDGEGN